MMKRTLVVILLFFFILKGFAQNLSIKGCLASIEDDSYIEFANISISKGNRVISSILSDKNGHFLITGLFPGDYSLNIAHVFYDSLTVSISNMSRNINLEKVKLDVKTHSLGEVSVIGARSIAKIDRQLFFPSKEDINKSSNGIELIENLGINGLIILKDNNSIVGQRGGSIPIRINGAPANPKELLAIDPKSVIRLEYHDLPSLRYGDAEGVVDVIVRNREDGGQIVWNSRNAFTFPWGDAYFSIKSNRGRSQWGINASYTIHSFEERYQSLEDVYTYDNGQKITRKLESIPSKFKEYYLDATAFYSYSTPDNLLFSAKVLYSKWSENPKSLYGNIIENKSTITNINLINEQAHREYKPSFDLYLQKKFIKNQLVAINVVGSYFNIERSQKIVEEDDGTVLTDINSIVEGRKYSIIGDLYFERMFLNGKFSAGITHTYGHSENDYSGSTIYQSNLKANNTYTYLEWNGKVKEFTYGIGAGFTFNRQKQKKHGTKNNTYINPTIKMSYPFGKNTELRYQSKMLIINTQLGETNAVETPIDSYLWWRGNPYLKPFINYINQLSLSHNIKKVRINFDVFDSYTPSGIMNNYFQEGRKLFSQQINGDIIHRLSLTGEVSVSLLKERLTLGINGGWRRNQSKSDYFNHIEWYWTVSGNASYRVGNVTLWGNVSPKMHNLTGESLYKSTQLISGGIDYRRKQLTVGLGYITYANKHSFESLKLSKYYQNNTKSYISDFQNLLYLRLSWNFNFGKSYKTQNRIKYKEDNDSGVTKQ